MDKQRIEHVLKVVAERRYVSGEDLMQLTDIGVPIYSQLSRSLGIPPAEVKGMMERKEISPEMLDKALAYNED